MSATEDLLRQLSTELKPVRRIAPLRVSAVLVLGLWAFGVLCEWRMGGARPALGELGRWHDPAYGALFGGLVLTAGGGLVEVLAQRMPGRDSLARAARATAAAGVLVAGIAAGMHWWHDGAGPMGGVEGSWRCVMRSLTLGAMPALAAALLLRRSWRVGEGWRVPLFAAPLGAVAVHASCVSGGGEHLLLGHALGPALGGTLIALGVWGLGRLRPPAR